MLAWVNKGILYPTGRKKASYPCGISLRRYPYNDNLAIQPYVLTFNKKRLYPKSYIHDWIIRKGEDEYAGKTKNRLRDYPDTLEK